MSNTTAPHKSRTAKAFERITSAFAISLVMMVCIGGYWLGNFKGESSQTLTPLLFNANTESLKLSQPLFYEHFYLNTKHCLRSGIKKDNILADKGNAYERYTFIKNFDAKSVDLSQFSNVFESCTKEYILSANTIDDLFKRQEILNANKISLLSKAEKFALNEKLFVANMTAQERHDYYTEKP